MSKAFINVPLFQGMDESGLLGLGEVFETWHCPADTVVFAAGDLADSLYLLVDGHVALHEEGEKMIELQPISLLGELGAMVGLNRRVTAVTLAPSVFLRASGKALRAFFESNPLVSVQFYQNLLGMAADKIRRDERRIDGMRRNIIRTQKALKQMREIVLDGPSTALSEPLHEAIEHVIAQNRRANYIVEPPTALPVYVRLHNRETYPVFQMSRQMLVLPEDAIVDGADWRGVLLLPLSEIPVSGRAEAPAGGRFRVELDTLIDEYAQGLEDYLAQAQLLDIVL
jgi:CRP/FNR family transcriptional regulator, cyclic AMP receptor protein